MGAILFHSSDDPSELWIAALKAAAPELEVRVWPDIGDVRDIAYALVWKPRPGMLAGLPNLQLIFSLGAGIDHILADPQRPEDVPIVRMVDPRLTAMMSEYAVLAVLWFHRMMPAYQRDQAERRWQKRWPAETAETAVGVLGLGAIGSDVARKLGLFGFPVLGWSRTPRRLEGVQSYHGAAGLNAMLPQARHLICVLPHTESTKGIVNAGLLAQLPPGAFFVNIGRGAQVVDADLLAALDGGRLQGAFLDVFNQEPLPPTHPYWTHPKVIMTPHIAGELIPASCARSVAANIARQRAGEAIPDIVDLRRGY